MSGNEIDYFINENEINVAPEFGSRAMLNLYLHNNITYSRGEYVQEGICQILCFVNINWDNRKDNNLELPCG